MLGEVSKGDVVVDDVKQRVGRVMDIAHRINRGRTLILRPPRGGIEWEQAAAKCRAPREDELVSAEDLRHVEQ